MSSSHLIQMPPNSLKGFLEAVKSHWKATMTGSILSFGVTTKPRSRYQPARRWCRCCWGLCVTAGSPVVPCRSGTFRMAARQVTEQRESCEMPSPVGGGRNWCSAQEVCRNPINPVCKVTARVTGAVGAHQFQQEQRMGGLCGALWLQTTCSRRVIPGTANENTEH